ncbi:MAG: aminoglycoside phosphotransferase family protein [Kineosporiaceae bacterium]
MRARMHPDEIATDVALLRTLLAGQFPHWADLPIAPVESFGTDHDIYRLGDRLVARLPRIGWATQQAEREALWLPRLAGRLPIAVPEPVALGRPGAGYPFIWSVCTWLPGANAHTAIERPDRAAADLAGFIRALRQVDTDGAHPRVPRTRGAPLAELDDVVRDAITDLGERIDGEAALRCWQESLEAPIWPGEGVWVHGDLLPGNLLVLHGRLSAVIDFGGPNVGDPACDLQPAWNMFDGTSRAQFLENLEADDAARLRGRGWVVVQTVCALPYYWDTNPGIVRQAWHALHEVLGEC